MATRNLFLNSAAGYVAMLIVMAVGIVSKMLLARLLSPRELGVFISAQTLFGMVIFLGSLGMNDAIARFVGLNARSEGESTLAIVS